MKYYSDITKQVYDTVDDLKSAENKVREENAAKDNDEKRFRDAIKIYRSAHKNFKKEYAAFEKKYGTWNASEILRNEYPDAGYDPSVHYSSLFRDLFGTGL